VKFRSTPSALSLAASSQSTRWAASEMSAFPFGADLSAQARLIRKICNDEGRARVQNDAGLIPASPVQNIDTP
jgi:hypothetical protein